MKGLSLHDLANDIAAVVRHEGGGPAVIIGHAFGNWVARMTAVDHPRLVRGVAIVAAAAKAYPAGFEGAKELSEAVRKAGDPKLPDAERLKYLIIAFFAPGSDASVWLKGWHPEVDEAQFGQDVRPGSRSGGRAASYLCSICKRLSILSSPVR